MLKLLILVLLLPTLLFSQEWDDSYWEKVNIYKDGKEIDFSDYEIFDAKCFDNDCIVALNKYWLLTELFKSSDGGSTWESIYDNFFDFETEEVPEDFIQYNPRLGEIQNTERIIFTYDDKNGILNKFDLNTFEHDTSFKLNTYSDIKNLYTNQNGYGIAAYGIQYYITKDNWESAEFYKTHSIREVMVTEDNTFFNSNTNPSDTIGKFNISKDGENWEQSNIGKGYIDKIYAYDNKLFWAGGIKYYSEKTKRYNVIYSSIDGGRSWDLQLEDSSSIGWSIRDIRFINEDIGIALSVTDDYYTTTNGGNEWINQKRISDPNFIEINRTFLSNNSLFQFVGSSGLYKYDLSLLKVTSVPLDDYKSIQTYPNPFQNSFRIAADDIIPSNYTLRIYTMNADLVLEKQVEFYDELEINADFPSGSYYLIMENESNHYLKKLIKE